MPLTRHQKDDLEHKALLAFSGSSVLLESGNGFRINRNIGQVAAVYWNENLPGNDIEIAICDTRMVDHYDLRTVRRWIERERKLSGRECNVHKHGSEWPILGFTYEDAITFLARCNPLRRGFLSPALLAELRAQPNAADLEHEELLLTLANLRPTTKRAVIDLVKAAGINIACWYTTKEDRPSKNPRSNPAYCFNWSFGGTGEPTVICLWHGSLRDEGREIVFDDNMRGLAEQLDAIADTPGEDEVIVGRARMQARRARAMDEALAIAFTSGQPLRVIVNEGLRRPADMLGQESSKVELRKLDDVDWRVVSYDVQTGAQRLVRQAIRQATAPVATPVAPNNIVAMPASKPERRFVDQFAIEPGEGKMVNRFEYSRSPQVREFVLKRACGFCELCGQKGFTTQAGTIYLETHHVVPLSEQGEDSIANVVAICPNDHRRAHFGEEASDIRQRLLTLLAEMAAEEAA